MKPKRTHRPRRRGVPGASQAPGTWSPAERGAYRGYVEDLRELVTGKRRAVALPPSRIGWDAPAPAAPAPVRLRIEKQTDGTFKVGDEYFDTHAEAVAAIGCMQDGA